MADGNLHIVVFPWLAFGHMLPFLELSKSLARRGHHISYISTPRNIQRLPKLPTDIAHLIDFIPFFLPKVEGLPETAEATSDLPSETVEYLKVAFDGLDKQFRKFIQNTTPKSDWIIQDVAQHWLPQIAAEAHVPTVWLSVFIAGALSFCGPLSEFGDTPSRTTAEQYTVPPPWIPFPSKLCYRLHEARRLLTDCSKPNISGYSDFGRVKLALEACKAVAVRSCTEVESEWLALLPELYGKPVIPVGLLPPPAPEERGESERGDRIIRWLDEQRSKSVIYIAFGSEATLSKEMLGELALGLELAGLPFVWALRGKTSLPEGFEERTEDYGIVARGWVPQLRILAHESIGGFLTHSGWSSVVESLQFGHPRFLLPIYVDQGLSARVIMEKGIAIEVRRDEADGSFTREAVAAALRLAVEEEEGELLRSRAKELREVFGNKDRQDKYVDDFVQYLQNHRSEAKNSAESHRYACLCQELQCFVSRVTLAPFRSNLDS